MLIHFEIIKKFNVKHSFQATTLLFYYLYKFVYYYKNNNFTLVDPRRNNIPSVDLSQNLATPDSVYIYISVYTTTYI